MQTALYLMLMASGLGMLSLTERHSCLLYTSDAADE